MAEDLGERTEDATPKRLQEAREEGNIARSMDAASAIGLLGVTITALVGLGPLFHLFGRLLRSALDPEHNIDSVRPESLGDAVQPALYAGAVATFPALLVAAAVAALAHLWQVGFVASSKALRPKPERINPLAGLKRILGTQGVFKLAVDLFKVGGVAMVAYTVVRDAAPRILALPGLDPVDAALVVGWLVFDLAIRVAILLLLLGLLDYAWQRWKYLRELRMTKQQVKEEYKQMEGDPEVKKRRMQIQRQIAMQRINAAVPKADVIVTNPEHISVALQYDPESMRAPKIVAMGADHLALRIRQIAKQHGVPIIERKPLARALYKQAKVGQEVPPDLYKAVAEVLAYVYRLDQAAGRRDSRGSRVRVRAAS